MLSDLSVQFEYVLKRWDSVSDMDKTTIWETEIGHLTEQISLKDWAIDAEELKSLNQSLATLNRQVESYRVLSKKIKDIQDLWDLVKQEESTELLPEIQRELSEILALIEEKELASLLNGKFDRHACYLSINAGAGGTESNDWALMLMRMYVRWAEKQQFSVTIVDELPGEEAGIKNVTLLIEGDYVYGYLQGEQGVHRLVRISPFDANKKRHTSFASVSIYPEIKEDIDVPIQPSDLRVDTFRASGAGGQHVNKTESAIRIVHIPTGITVTCQEERSQHKNRERAMNILKSRLYQYNQQKNSEELKYLTADKKDIAWGNQIRSYVFQPYQLIKDHRTKAEVGNIDKVLDGDLDLFLFEYLKWRYKK